MNSYKIPIYWEKHLEEKIRRIQDLQAIAGEYCACVAMLTDFHLRENVKNSVALLERILTECNIPYFLNAGDIVSGAGLCTAEFLIEEIQTCQKLFLSIQEKCLYVEGNHDRAYSTFEPPAYYQENLPKQQFNRLYFSPMKKYPNRKFGDGGYYYTDDATRKMRYIVLNSQDVPNEEKTAEGYAKYNVMRHFGFLQKQIEWFAHVALAVPDSEWNVVVCSHATPVGAEKEQTVYNYDLILGVIDAFKKHALYQAKNEYGNPLFNASVAVDFTNRGGNFVAWLGGHRHKDDINEIGGVVCVDTTTDAAYVGANPDKIGSIKEQAFDVLTIDTKKRRAYMTRIGTGLDREFSY